MMIEGEILLKGGAVGVVYLATLLGSGWVVRIALAMLPEKVGNNPEAMAAGVIIGKCENLIAVTCVLADQLTGLALIFAAKSLVRNSGESVKDDYYLCGTLVNLVWSIGMGYVAKFLWAVM